MFWADHCENFVEMGCSSPSSQPRIFLGLLGPRKENQKFEKLAFNSQQFQNLSKILLKIAEIIKGL